MAMNKAIFIDKDGTLIPDIPYNTDPSRIRFNDFVGESLLQLSKEGYLLVVISNQSGVAKGLFTEEKLDHVTEKLQELADHHGFAFDGFYYCMHDESTGCHCRKPLPGLILKASSFLDIDRKHSWMIGDILNDVEAGFRAGCKTVLVDNGGETEWHIARERIPDIICDNIKTGMHRIIHDPTFRTSLQDPGHYATR
jgi:histidinol-phosphate phosphatase family protein